MKKFISFITALTLFFSISLPSVQAFYSPILAEETNLIQQHIAESKQKHGVGSLYDLGKKLVENNQQKNEKGLVLVFMRSLAEFLRQGFVNAFADVPLALFNFWAGSDTIVTNCMRDDIWELQVLQEQVINEMFKAAFRGDAELAGKLWKDFQLIDYRIWGGTITNEKGEKEPVIGLAKSYASSYWFPSSQQFYLNCPYGEYKMAIQALSQSIDRFKALGQPGGLTLGSFKSISKIARQRAIVRARQWIAANQLQFSLGGPQGSNPKSLVTGPGFTNGVWKDLLKEFGYMKDIVNETTVKTIQETINQANQASDVETYAVAYQKALAQQKLLTNQIEQTLTFNLTLNNVSEESLKAIDNTLRETNFTIKNMYDKAYSKEGNVASLCRLMNDLVKRQCTKKTPNLPSCT